MIKALWCVVMRSAKPNVAPRPSERWRLQFSVVAIVLLAATEALAQSSVGRAASTATALSLEDAVSQNQKEMLDQEVLGAPAGGAGFAGASPSGKLRQSHHDWIRPRSDTNQSFDWETDEGSAFSNLVATLPGKYLGGQLKVGGFVGYNWLSLDLQSSAVDKLDANQHGSAENDSALAGVSAVWAAQGYYVLTSVVGMWGETSLVDGIDDCGLGPQQNICAEHRYRFDTRSFLSTVTAGKVIPLSNSPSGPMLDLRGSISYINHDSQSFLNEHAESPDRDRQKYELSTWTGTGAITIFYNNQLGDGAVLRPYVQAYFRQEMDYDNKLSAIESGSGDVTVVHYEQDHLYGGLDAGLTYEMKGATFGGALYLEGSGDDRIFGGRLSASWNLN